MHVATLVLSDPDLNRKGALLHAMSQGARDWHSRQAADARTPAQNLQYYQQQARGACWPSVQWVFHWVASAQSLASVGFLLSYPDSLLASLTEEHPPPPPPW